MPRPILAGLALREDDAAPLALARVLARLTDAPLELLTALPHDVPGLLPVPDYTLALRDDARERLAAVAAPLHAEHDVETLVAMGSPAEALHDAAVAHTAAAIVVGSSHRGGIGRVLAGDVAVGLLHGSPCPVAVAPRDYAAGAAPARIAAAYLPTPDGRAALTAAAELAQGAGATVDVLSVLEPPTYYPAAQGLIPMAELDTERRVRVEHATDEALAMLPQALRGNAVVLPDGGAVAMLTEASASYDLLVIGSRGYGAVRGVLAGSVSRGLAHAARCPLLVVPRATAEREAAAA